MVVEPSAKISSRLCGLFPKPPQRMLIVAPPGADERDFDRGLAVNRRYWSYPPYGPALLSAAVRGAGYWADVEDLNHAVLSEALWCRPAKDFDYNIWRGRLRFRFMSSRPDLVGISCMFTMQHNAMRLIAQEAKAAHLPVMAGGVHVTNASEFVLRDIPEIDFLGLYESDLSLPHLMDVMHGKRPVEEISQVAMIIDGEYVSVEGRMPPSGTQTPVPDYCHLDLTEYEKIGQVGTYSFLRTGRPAGSALAKRGCRARCSFCSVRFFNGPNVRSRGAATVADEIERLYQRGIRHITWLDDDLLFNQQESIALFNEIARRKMDLTWDGSNGLIAAAITPPLLDAMVQSGCVGFNLGIESGSPRILREVHKPGTVDSFRKAKPMLDKYPHLFIKGFLIMGFPHETLAEMKMTVDLAVELGFDWYPLQILNPLPSTEIYRTMTEEGLLEDNLNTDGRGFMAGIFSSLNQRERERNERTNAADFFDLLAGADLEVAPSAQDMADLWFLMDYKMNYEPIFHMTPGPKLENKRRFLIDIADRITQENPLANYFLAQASKRLGDEAVYQVRMQQTGDYLVRSDYWRKRFHVLGLSEVIEEWP